MGLPGRGLVHPDPQGPHVARETWTVKFNPTVIESFSPVSDGVARIVGVSDDYDAVQKAVDSHDKGVP